MANGVIENEQGEQAFVFDGEGTYQVRFARQENALYNHTANIRAYSEMSLEMSVAAILKAAPSLTFVRWDKVS